MPKDLSLLELNRAILNRQAGRKTLWQPRIGCWLDDRKHDGRLWGRGSRIAMKLCFTSAWLLGPAVCVQ